MDFSAVARLGSAVVLVAAAALLSPATAQAAPTHSRALATSPALLKPVAVSGKSILVEAEGTFRLSKNAGKTWVAAKVRCQSLTFCDPTIPNGMIGTVAGGIVSLFDTQQVSAFSLTSNAPVGTAYRPTADELIVDLNGANALIADVAAKTLTVRSLAGQTTRSVAWPGDHDNFRLLADGSVLARAKADPSAWDRIDSAGTASRIASDMPGASPILTAGLAVFGGAGRVCVLNTTTRTDSCRAGLGDFSVASASPHGVLIQHGTKARWLSISATGSLGKAVSVATRLKGNTVHVATVENAYPVIARRTSARAELLTVGSGGRISTRQLGWARVATIPDNLELTPTTVLGQASDAAAWRRSTAAGLPARKSLGVAGDVATSGARWAVSGTRIALYDRGQRDGTAPVSGSVLRLSGAQLLVGPECSVPLGDPDATCPTREIWSVDGHRLATLAADDIFGEWAVVRTGSRTGLRVVDYLHPQATGYTIDLPDPGADNGYVDIRLWGDWIAATISGRGMSAVAYNYRTGAVRTSAEGFSVEALGDGFAVLNAFRATNDNQLQIWNLRTGGLSTLSSVSRTVAVDGATVAYVKGKPGDVFATASLVVTRLAGMGASAPRVVGVVAPSTWTKSWRLDVDVTKPLKAGHLQVRDASGRLVRSIRTPATKDGGLRTIRWDGRDSAGRKVPAGVYSYQLASRAADGSGTVVRADGSAGAIGTLTVG